MYQRLIVFVAFLSCAFGTRAQSYSVDHIPAEIKDYANVVKRMERVNFDIISPTNTILKRQYALTILNEQGAEHAQFAVYYSKLSSLKSFTGILYDAHGKELQKIKWKDLKDESAVSGSNLMDDYRVKRYDLYYRNYPYTIVYEYEEQYNNSLFFENWQPVEDEKFAVEQSAFTIRYPKGTKVRYRAFNYPKEAIIKEEKGIESISWEVEHIKALKYETLSKPVYELTPTVLTGPEAFQIEGYNGNMATWKDFGAFVYTLIKDRQELPAKIKQEVFLLTKDLDNEYDKIEVLYKYLQKNTRYISIQLGLGGWQPFNATYVANNAYGDCKALVNYMRSLLKEAGIPSCYTLVKAGNSNRKVIIDLPSQQFNHVILCVPTKQDTIWLECTSQILPVGYLSSFTQNRYALLINEDGGQLVQTPKYDLEKNRQFRDIRAVVQENGDLDLQVATTYAGLQQDDVHDMMHYLTKDEMKKHLNKSLPLSTYDVISFSYETENGRVPSIKENLEISASGYARVTGKRLLIEANVLSKRQGRLPKEPRMTPIVLSYPYVDVDSIEISLPKGYVLEKLPEHAHIESKFGSYSLKITVKEDKIFCYRFMTQYDGEYPASDYDALMAFYDTIHLADRKQVILVKEE